MSHRRLIDLLRRLGHKRRPSDRVVEGLARVGYGARGFVYLSAGALTLAAALQRGGEAITSSGAVGWLAQQPFGKVWLVLLGLGLWAFVAWRAVQALFDVDHQGRDLKGMLARAGQAASGVAYGLLAATVFEYLDEFGDAADPAAADAAENREKAEILLALPMGQGLLVAVGLVILAVGVGYMVRAWREDFGDALACPPDLCRKLTPLARTGYAARGFAYLPLAAFVILAGLQAEAAKVTSLGEALEALERQPGGSWMLGATALGLMAFGAFAFVEARWRRIRRVQVPAFAGMTGGH
jgi:hypothetical protein